MIAVIFEVTLDDDRAPRYFDLAGALKPELEQVDGFISVERFQSLVNEGKQRLSSLRRALREKPRSEDA